MIVLWLFTFGPPISIYDETKIEMGIVSRTEDFFGGDETEIYAILHQLVNKIIFVSNFYKGEGED